MRFWLHLVTGWPRATVAAVALVTLGFGACLPSLRVETDGHAFVPVDHPTIRRDRELRALFGLRDPLLVALDAGRPGGVFAPAFLARLTALTDRVRAVPGIDADAVTSLATVPRVMPLRGEAALVPLLPRDVVPAAAASELRDYVLRSTPYAGLLVSHDGSAAAIVAAVARGAARERVYDELRQALADSGGAAHIGGAVAAESQLGAYVVRDLVTLLPLVAAVVGSLLFLTYRSLRAVLLPVSEVLIVLVWTFGLMALLGSPVYVVTAILPVILMAVGVADEIHILGHYYEEAVRRPAADVRTVVVAAIERVRIPVIFAAVTTALGFLSFGGASMPPLRSFGLYTAFGVIAGMVLTLTFVPAVLVLLPVRVNAQLRREYGAGGEARPGWVARALVRLGAVVGAWPRLVLAGAVLAALAAVPGIARLRVEDSWFGNFPEESEVRTAGRFFDARLAGSHELDVVVDAGGPGAALDPDFLGGLAALARALRREPTVRATLSVVQSLELLPAASHRSDGLPATSAEVAQRLLLAQGGAGLGGALVDPAQRQVALRVYLAGPTYRSVDRLMRRIGVESAAAFGARARRVELAGDVVASQVTVGLIVSDQVRTLLLALGMVSATAVLVFRSVAGGVLAVLPLGLAVALNFAVMGWCGVPLGIATSMFASLAIGIGVDYSIHFLARYQQERRGLDARAATSATLAGAGRAIFANAGVVALGYLVLGASAMPPNHYLGMLVALSMGTSFLATMTLLPAALAVRPFAFTERMPRA